MTSETLTLSRKKEPANRQSNSLSATQQKGTGNPPRNKIKTGKAMPDGLGNDLRICMEFNKSAGCTFKSCTFKQFCTQCGSASHGSSSHSNTPPHTNSFLNPAGWERHLSKSDADYVHIIEGVRNGFHIVDDFPFAPAEVDNYTSATGSDARVLVKKQILTELCEGRYV